MEEIKKPKRTLSQKELSLYIKLLPIKINQDVVGTPRKVIRQFLLSPTKTIALIPSLGTYYILESCAKQIEIGSPYPIQFISFTFPFVYTFHKNSGLLVYYVVDESRIFQSWEGDCLGIVSSLDYVVLVSPTLIETYMISNRPLQSIKIGSYSTTYGAKGLHIIKFEGDLLVCGVNETLMIFDVKLQKEILQTKSKDNSYFLFGSVQGNKVFCATACLLYVFTFTEDRNQMIDIIIPLPSPISCLQIHNYKILCGCFDGIIRVYDGDNRGTFLYDINSIEAQPLYSSRSDIFEEEKSQEESPKKNFTVRNRIVAMQIFGEFILATTRNGSCNVWNLGGKYQSQSLVNFILEKGCHVSEIILEPPMSSPTLVLLLFNEDEDTWGTYRWKPKIERLERIFNENVLAQYIAKPKLGKKGIISEWKKNNKKGMEHEEFIIYIQELANDEYPFLADCFESCTITNNTLPDNPIVFVNHEFEVMTGYSRDEIVGRNCRFLQGKYTDSETVNKVSQAIKRGKTVSVQILNYRKDGVPFWNVFVVLPVHDKDKEAVVAFLAIQKNLTLVKLEETPICDWLFHDVALWLEQTGLGVYSQIFFMKKIVGRQLLRFSIEQLITHVGMAQEDAEKLLCNIEEHRVAQEITAQKVAKYGLLKKRLSHRQQFK